MRPLFYATLPVKGTIGADIASADTTDIGAVSGTFHRVTGTTQITSFGTAYAGMVRVLLFTGSLAIIPSANIFMPMSASVLSVINFTVHPGDVGIFTSLGGGVWQCDAYTYGDGRITAFYNSTTPNEEHTIRGYLHDNALSVMNYYSAGFSAIRILDWLGRERCAWGYGNQGGGVNFSTYLRTFLESYNNAEAGTLPPDMVFVMTGDWGGSIGQGQQWRVRLPSAGGFEVWNPDSLYIGGQTGDGAPGQTIALRLDATGNLSVKRITTPGGTFTLTAGAATVTDATITANSVVVPCLKTVGGTVAALPFVATITAGVGFTVAGGGALNTSVYNYVVFEKA